MRIRCTSSFTVGTKPLESRALLTAISVLDGLYASPSLNSLASVTNPTPQGYTPSQIRSAYGFNGITFNGSIQGDGTGQTIAIVDSRIDTSHPDFAYKPETGEELFHSFAGVPIVRKGDAVGVLCVQHAEPREYQEVEIEALQTVAMVLSELIANAGLADEKRRGAEKAPVAQSVRLTGLTNGASLVSSLLASVSMPVFDGGATTATLRAQEAALVQAQASYQSTVLTALQEVEDALAALRGHRARLQHLQSAATAAELAALLAQQRYASGLIDFQTVLTTQRTLLSAQNSVASTLTDLGTDHVRLYKALGGGWQPASSAATAPTAPTLSAGQP